MLSCRSGGSILEKMNSRMPLIRSTRANFLKKCIHYLSLCEMERKNGRPKRTSRKKEMTTQIARLSSII